MRKGKPNWWMLYALIPSIPLLLVVEGRIPGASLEHRLMEFGIVLLGFGLMALWVRANESALIEQEMANVKWSIVYDSEAGLGHLPLADCDDDVEECIANLDLPSTLEKDNLHARSTSTGDRVIPGNDHHHRPPLPTGSDGRGTARVPIASERQPDHE